MITLPAFSCHNISAPKHGHDHLMFNMMTMDFRNGRDGWTGSCLCGSLVHNEGIISPTPRLFDPCLAIGCMFGNTAKIHQTNNRFCNLILDRRGVRR